MYRNQERRDEIKKKSFIKKTRKEEKEELKPGFDQVRNYLEILEILDIEAMYSKLLQILNFIWLKFYL